MTLILPWRIELFGTLRARRGDHSVERFRRGKEAALLAYLALHLRQSHARENLIDRFWPEASPEAGRLNLRVALHSLRRRLEPPGTLQGGILVADRATVQLNPGMVVTDVSEFEEALLTAHADPSVNSAYFQKAVAVYSGELLPGYDEEWIGPERERLSLLFVEALRELAQALGKAGETASALDFALRAVAADPLHEKAHLVLMRLFGQAGRTPEALLQYNRLRRLLRRELATVPSAEARRLARDLKLRPESFLIPTPQSAPSTAPSVSDLQLLSHQRFPKRQAGMRSGLPLPATRFFGREHELASLRELLRQPVDELGGRLITLSGPGGAGKTRLALEAVHRLDTGEESIGGRSLGQRSLEQRSIDEKSILFPYDNLWFVALADLPAPALLADSIRTAVCRKATEDRDPLDQIVQELSGQSVLLILDNFERLVEEGASLVSRLLEDLPHLKCLVTTRRQLGLPGEQVVEVLPLPVPQEELPPERLLAWPSVRLFVDRAQAKAPEFQVTPVSAKAVFELVRGLEGIPLALELAAAWSRVQTPSRMVQELKDRYGWLTKNSRGVHDRHRTLREAVEWSHALLPLEAQDSLAFLSTFRGGWSQEAAEKVCRQPQPATLLATLQEHSWITSEEIAVARSEEVAVARDVSLEGGTRDEITSGAGTEKKETVRRFQMLETLREFAAEHLLTLGRASEAYSLHLQYFLDLAQQAEPEMSGPGQAPWLERLGREQDNLRTALDWAATNDVNAGLRLVAALWPFWEIRGYWREGQEWAEMLLRKAGETDSQASSTGGKSLGMSDERDENKANEAARARVLTNLGALACRRSQYPVAISYTNQALALWRRQEDMVRIGISLGNLGVAALEQYDYSAAASYLEEARTVQEASGDQSGLSRTLNNLAILAWRREDFVEARACYEAALPLKRAQKDLNGLASTLNNLGALLKDLGNLAEARSYFEECETSFERMRRYEPGRKGEKRMTSVTIVFLC